MSSVVKMFFFIAILIVINNDLSLAQMNCAKIDFNRTSVPELRECKGKNLPNFVIKTYSKELEPAPYRSNAIYFLSNNFHDTYTCTESTMQFTMKPTTLIEAAVYLKSFGISFLEIVVYDADRNERIDSVRTDGTNGWQILHANIRKTIQNARVG